MAGELLSDSMYIRMAVATQEGHTAGDLFTKHGQPIQVAVGAIGLDDRGGNVDNTDTSDDCGRPARVIMEIEPTAVVISSGTLDVTGYRWVTVCAESGVTDNLDSITGLEDYQIVYLVPDTGDTITLRDQSVSGGNLQTGPPRTLGSIYQTYAVQRRGSYYCIIGGDTGAS